jgi:hypothetical protein
MFRFVKKAVIACSNPGGIVIAERPDAARKAFLKQISFLSIFFLYPQKQDAPLHCSGASFVFVGFLLSRCV